jgi:murein DD-endopeptidase MepM/ murein hydrolase activator NlpD
LSQHRSSRSAGVGVATNARHVRCEPSEAEITDIIPFDRFSDLDDLDCESQVLLAPELDDLNDMTEPTPLRLVVPPQFRVDPSAPRAHRYRDDDATDVMPIRRGNHRKPTSTGDAVKGRLLIAAMATGAVAAAAHSAVNAADAKASTPEVLTADASPMKSGADVETSKGVQLISVSPATSSTVHGEELAKGVAFAQERAEREARLQRPLYVMPTHGIFTSGFGYRWGALHGGIDLANSIGTPIYAVSDGVVIDAGPVAGFGMWVKLRHADGTVTLYGHVNTTTVRIGQRVMAGDQIATMGNRGNSTGPHLHFEVLLNGTSRTDPLPWLSKRGINVGPYKG